MKVGVFVLSLFVGVVLPSYAPSPLQDNLPTGRRPEHGHTDARKDSSQPNSKFRLPTALRPMHYNLRIRPILTGTDVFTAPGTVIITLNCVANTRDIVLHAFQLLSIDEPGIQVANAATPETVIPVSDVSYNEENQSMTMSLDEELVEGETYLLSISFVAAIAHPTDRMNGLYRSSYQTAEGEEKWIATTHFSRALAFRKVLPSFDEPSQKAIFEISIGRQEGYHALSNMNIRETEPIDGMEGWFWEHFHPTPIMAPTVIAMVVSDFSSEEAPAGIYSKPVAVWGPPPVVEAGDAEFSAEAVAKILNEYDSYFGILYELPKMDSVGLGDFQAGAMENWGLNLYRSVYMFWNSGSTAAAKFGIPNVISHELAHQWWGNLVTHAWWNDWWLTEGFATYYQYVLFEQAYPNFAPANRIITDEVQPALAFDITPASVPIHGSVTEEFVENPSQINYSKGSSLVRMMSGFLSKDVFTTACTHYLLKRSYTAVHQDALFADLQESLEIQDHLPANGRTMAEIMNTWTLQTGFPLVRVIKSAVTPNLIYFSQESFEQGHADDPDNKSWHIPIAYSSKSEPLPETDVAPQVWIQAGQVLVPYTFPTDDWIVVNAHGTGYFRVLYDAHFATLLRTQLSGDIQSVVEASRSQIVDDYFSAAYEGYALFQDALLMTEFMREELAYSSWVPFLKHLRKPYTLFASNATSFAQLKEFVLPKTTTVMGAIGVEQPVEEDPPITILRALILDWLCGMGDASCFEYATDLFAIWIGAPATNPVPVDLRSILYCAAAAEGTQENWDFLRDRYEETKETAFRTAFRCTTDQVRLRELLDEAILEGVVPKDQAWAHMEVVGNSIVGRPMLIQLLEENLPQLVEYVGEVNGLAGILSSMAPVVFSDEDIAKIEAIIGANAAIFAPIEEQVNGALEVMRSNGNWMRNFGEKLLRALPVSTGTPL